MSEYVLKAKEWWGNLKTREKQTVLIGGVVLVIACLYFGIWSPLINKMALTRQQILVSENLFAFMKAADKAIASRTTEISTRPKVTPVALMSDLQNKIKESGLSNSLTQLKQLSNDTVTLQFQKVDFDQSVQLFLSLIKQYNVSIVQWSVTRDKTPGVVSQDVVIKIN
jgi:general secretion pathway protein M